MDHTDYDSIESQNSGSANNLLKRSTRCPACQTLLNFPANIQKSITCPRPWCKLRFNPLDEPNWPASQVAPPPRGKEQRFCYNCDTLCNYNKGVTFFICPKCQQITFVDFQLYLRRSVFLMIAGICIILMGGGFIAWSSYLSFRQIVFLALSVVLFLLGLFLLARSIILRRQTNSQIQKHRMNNEKASVMISVS
eukprot:c9488_g1_i1.p1 GENE.c9488_g1_i1~~c9488_g1_i1.p1  ORF type:complete len:194 (+),score=15.60 c9488_g1_i1:205-786(+)